MKKRQARAWVLAVAMLCGGTAVQAQQTFTMKLSSPAINDVTHEWMKLFKAAVEPRAKGRLKVEIYPANQLGPLPRTVEGVALGTIELTFGAVGYFAAYDPRFEALEVAGLFDDVTHANRVMADPEVRKRLAGYGAAKGIESLACVANGPSAVASTKPLRTPDDFKGVKLRTTGTTPMQVNPMRALGASPIAMPIGEALPSMQNKTIDAAMAGPVLFIGFKYYDVVKQFTLLPKSYLMACAVANKDFLTSLGPELEQIVREEAQRAQTAVVPKFQVELDAIRRTWEQNGGAVYEFSPADATRYLSVVSGATAAATSAPAVKPEIDVLEAAARRLRTP